MSRMWSGAATLACLQRIHVLTTFRHGLPAPRVLAPENVDVRVFLAGFMIAYRPTRAFEEMGALEQALFDSTVQLIEAFERICLDSATKSRRMPRLPTCLTSLSRTSSFPRCS